MTVRGAPTTKEQTRRAPPRTTTKKKKAPLPARPIATHAPADDVDEPYVLSKPPTGRSGDLNVRKPVHDALRVDPSSMDPHVFKLTSMFAQDVTGLRVAWLCLWLDDASPTLKDLGEERLQARIAALTAAGQARLAAVLGDDFRTHVWFGGKHFRP
jgi:hypothetical protein